MELVGVAAGGGDVPDGGFGGLHQLRRLGQAQADEKFLGRAAHRIPEQLAEIAAVELAHIGDLLHGELPAVVLLHEGDGLLNVEILETGAPQLSPGRGGLNQPVQEQAQVPNEAEGGGVGVVGDVEHGVPHRRAQGWVLGLVNGLGFAQPGGVEVLLRPQPAEFQPGVLPGIILVGIIGVYLPGADEEALVGAELVVPGDAVGAVGVQAAPARDHIVEQEVVAHKGSEGVQGRALFPAELEQPQIQEIFIGENGKGEGVVSHGGTSFLNRVAKPGYFMIS